MDTPDTSVHTHTPQSGQTAAGRGPLFFAVGMGVFFVSSLILLAAAYMYINANNKPADTVGIDSARILATIQKSVDFPKGETPQIASITDLTPLKNQPFFARARMGDVLIVFARNHLAILYDTEAEKIVNMNRISIVVPQAPASPVN